MPASFWTFSGAPHFTHAYSTISSELRRRARIKAMGWTSKKITLISVTAIALLLMAATVPLAIWVTHWQTAQVANARDRCQGGQQAAYTVRFQPSSVSPGHTDGHLCDRLTFINDT